MFGHTQPFDGQSYATLYQQIERGVMTQKWVGDRQRRAGDAAGVLRNWPIEIADDSPRHLLDIFSLKAAVLFDGGGTAIDAQPGDD